MTSFTLFQYLLSHFPGANDACLPIELSPNGKIIYDGVPYDQNYLYISPFCPMGSLYIYDLNRLFENNFHVLTASTQSWKNIYTVHSGYSYSIPVFVSIMSFALVMTAAMSIMMSISRHSRFPWTIRFAVYFGTAETIAIFSIMMEYLRMRHTAGGNSVSLTVIDLMTKPHEIASYVASTLLQYCLVIVAKQMFKRGFERKCVGIGGNILITTSVILSGLSSFLYYDHTMLTAFHYLIELSVYFLFALAMLLRATESIQAAFSADLVCLTIIAMASTWLAPALYVADFYGWWHARMIDQLCPFTTIVSVVTVWYWIQKVGDMEQALADSHQLGRRVVDSHVEYCTFNDNQGEFGESKKIINSHSIPHWAKTVANKLGA